jgi:hypothetical protein
MNGGKHRGALVEIKNRPVQSVYVVCRGVDVCATGAGTYFASTPLKMLQLEVPELFTAPHFRQGSVTQVSNDRPLGPIHAAYTYLQIGMDD